jgi:hypothetical protein
MMDGARMPDPSTNLRPGHAMAPGLKTGTDRSEVPAEDAYTGPCWTAAPWNGPNHHGNQSGAALPTHG